MIRTLWRCDGAQMRRSYLQFQDAYSRLSRLPEISFHKYLAES